MERYKRKRVPLRNPLWATKRWTCSAHHNASMQRSTTEVWATVGAQQEPVQISTSPDQVMANVLYANETSVRGSTTEVWATDDFLRAKKLQKKISWTKNRN
eukprot:TRINITY_DN30518_c0_g1_i3.p1 TRINITY_DN30518_c0_g1~~TRINITY_DN30518_c0_g1_i3.p1  ORF type:complete len:101 (-),score=2.80 TRINITY_DN30518_c0_g1_i3:25-327(-)